MKTRPALLLAPLTEAMLVCESRRLKWTETCLDSINDLLLSSGDIQPCLRFLLVCHQETRGPVASQCDWGDSWKHVLHHITWCKGHLFSLSLQDALIKLMGEVCDLLPESYKNQCDDFIAKYGTEIVEFLLSSAAPHTICTLLHLCLFEEQTVPGQSHWTVSWVLLARIDSHAPDPLLTTEPSLPSDCESCRTLAVLSRLNNGPNSTQPETSSFLQSVCFLYPNAIPKVWPSTTSKQPSAKYCFKNECATMVFFSVRPSPRSMVPGWRRF